MMEFMRENAILLDSERLEDAKGGAIAPQQAFSVAAPAYILGRPSRPCGRLF